MSNTKKIDSGATYYLMVGTYTSGNSEGIYMYQFNAETGEISTVSKATGVENPSFVIFGQDAKTVYSVNELHQNATVSSFLFDKESGVLTFLNKQPSMGGDPCYLTATEDHLFVGNYSGGNLSVYPIQEDGSAGEPVQTILHEGSSANKQRQEKAHVHSTVLSPDAKYLFVVDLGTDKINVYSYNPENKEAPLTAADQPFIKVMPGSGPRHLTFDSAGNFAYVIFELTAEVAVFKHHNGQLTHTQTISMLDEGFEGDVGGAEVKLSPDGKFLYASNRGDANEIIIYSIDQESGRLSFVDRQSSMGKAPRNFMIDPTGNFLLVANQNSDNIVVFKRDIETGKLQATDQEIEVGNPVYLTMTRKN